MDLRLFMLYILFLLSLSSGGRGDSVAIFDQIYTKTNCCAQNTKKATADLKSQCAVQCTLDGTCQSFSFNKGLCILADSPYCTELNVGVINKKSNDFTLSSVTVAPDLGYEQWIGDRRFWVFQQKKTRTVNFTRNWTDYERGFGNTNEFWSGLIYLSRTIAQYGDLTMRVELTDWSNFPIVAEYLGFSVQGACTNYTMNYKQYLSDRSNTTGDSLSRSVGKQFSTYDADHDTFGGSCSRQFYGGAAWWYGACSFANPNGPMFSTEKSTTTSVIPYIYWYHMHSSNNSVKAMRIMLEIPSS